MDIAFFEGLTPEEAGEYLEHYLDEVSRGAQTLLDEAERAGVSVDFSLASVPGVMRFALDRLETSAVPEDPDVPWWIRATPEYRDGLFEFTDESGILVLRASYYFGESFVRSYAGTLRWDVGSNDTAEFQMPVVTGFPTGAELAPLMVVDNLMRRALISPERGADFETAVEAWRQPLQGARE